MSLVASSAVLVLIVCLASVASIHQSFDEEWELFKSTYAKNYSETENELRMNIFRYNLRKIELHNASHGKGEVSYTLAINEYSDLLPREFAAIMTGYRSENSPKSKEKSLFVRPPHIHLPDSVDWYAEGAVTPVNNQGSCGSCWAFSVTGALEGQHFRKTGELISLSAQNLIDCDYRNNGCTGGNFGWAFDYIKTNGGIDSASSYPYEAATGPCRFNATNVAATDTGYMVIEAGDEEALKAAVAMVGPIAVGMDATRPDFLFYSKGVYIDPTCRVNNINHSALVVGYGTEEGIDYWLVKNSWGTSWGDMGYIKMARNLNNQCGIASMAYYPLV